ncbi:MAG: hypothetical protein L0Z50_38520 [Verrucomicrobiales bacterium]|nr:hypothetical protein [Verrucomicrobiales bacterium]
MTDQTDEAPTIDLDREPTPKQEAEMRAQLRKAMLPPPPTPTEALTLLFVAACSDTGGSQAARNFLFWLPGLPDPTGFKGDGGLELRRLDGKHKAAALEVLSWWAGPTKSDQPLYEILDKLHDRFAIEKDSET